jgi:hypothetical protein
MYNSPTNNLSSSKKNPTLINDNTSKLDKSTELLNKKPSNFL